MALLSFSLMAMGVKMAAPEPKPFRHSPLTLQEQRWDTADIDPKHLFRIEKAIALYLDTKPRYEKITAMRKNGVPAPVIFVLHGRESTWSFRKHLHEGSSLRARTRWVPKGRPKAAPRSSGGYTFEESAEDALYKLKDLESKNWGQLHRALQTIEEYNGTGYLRYRKYMNSPYMYAGTNKYNCVETLPNGKKKKWSAGKYVADGKFSRTAVDKQLGVCAILKRMEQRGIKLGFK